MSPADQYSPVYVPDGTFTVSVSGVSRGLRSFDLCLDPNDMPNLIDALASLGFTSVVQTDDWPWLTNGPVPPSFSDSLGRDPDITGKVPWIQFDPLSQPIQAGVIAGYFSHGVTPFEGSQYEADLRARIQSLDQTQS